MFLIFDTETTGLPRNYNAPLSDFDNWPRLVQLAWQTHDEKGNLIEAKNYIVKPEGFEIPYGAEKVHGISTEMALKNGLELDFVLKEFANAIQEISFIIGHNVEFDINILGAEYLRKDIPSKLLETSSIDTKETSTDFCAIPGGRGGKFKWPNLTELHQKLFSEGFDEAHNASADVAATARCFLELIRIGVINKDQLNFNETAIQQFKLNNPSQIKTIDLKIISNHSETEQDDSVILEKDDSPSLAQKETKDFIYTHLHVHTQYSILDGAADIPGLIQKAKADGQVAMAITDHGNMFGAKLFHKVANKAGIKPILGCEVYVAHRSLNDKEKQDSGSEHLILLAKNNIGYHNLIKMVSKAWLDGYYYKPRIDKKLLEENCEGIICTSACLGGEISQKIMNHSIEEAENAAKWYKDLFGEDYYFELQRHPSGDAQMDERVFKDQQFVNKTLLKLGEKLNIKCIASNDVHFINKEDAPAQDRLLCISTGKDVADTNRMRYTEQEWMKTQDEMKELFSDIPQVLANTQEIVDKVENYKLDQKPIMPDFALPEGYESEDEYLKYITYEGAKKRWPEITPEIKERIDFELETIKKMGFPGYFLIVWDFIKAAREMDVSVGPGRGSAAGSVVAYSLKITEIDPIKYQLLFERFLNPDRVSMPDIDIDFDEDGRGKVLEWVVNKYGSKRVAHIITFGTMAAKSAIRDVARVQGLPLPDSDRLAKLVPERPGTTLKDAFKEVKELREAKVSPNAEISSVLKYAEVLEGSVRNTGTHACGIIIGKDDLENYVPISTAKESELTYVTQFDGKHVEDIGLLKMDFLGLKTLSIIKDAVKNIKYSKGVDIDIDHINLDDKKTYELFSNGETTGLFQFESDGMKKHLRDLKPSVFEDLIAMNALYRPGPMEYIPQFVARKNGREKISYDLPEMENYLKDTYGITVYQEQVMLLSRQLANFTRGESDSLRKAMGKKIKSMMDELKVKFEDGCKANPKFMASCDNLNKKPNDVIKKIWGDWEEFAKYAFNKSHATCYSYIAYQTGYLKAHYPGEFMSAVLSRNMNDIKKVSFFMDECKRMGLKVLGPDVNESFKRFTVNDNGDIRFGLAAIKGVGDHAVEEVINERLKNGKFKDIFDFVERVNLQQVNKKNLEGFAYSGALDSFTEIKRGQYVAEDEKGISFIEYLTRYGSKLQTSDNAGMTLFGDSTEYSSAIEKPKAPIIPDWNKLEKLNKEKELIGIYLSAHPLDDYKLEIDRFCNFKLSEIKNLDVLKGKDLTIAGIVTATRHAFTKTGKPFGSITIEDYSDSFQLTLFGKDYENFRKYFYEGYSLFIKGRVDTHRFREGEYELSIKSISTLEDVREDLIKSIQISVSLNDITDENIKEIRNFATQNAGNKSLKFRIIDPEEKISVELFSRTLKVELTPKFINFLNNNPAFDFKINA